MHLCGMVKSLTIFVAKLCSKGMQFFGMVKSLTTFVAKLCSERLHFPWNGCIFDYTCCLIMF